jgi:hypothetical protein
MTKTKTGSDEVTEAQAPEGFGPTEEASQALPPLAILRVGDSIEGVLKETNLVEDDEKPGKFRNFYRIQLSKDCTAMDKEDAEREFENGGLVSCPGSGGLDYSIGKLALKTAGKPSTETKVPWEVLNGHWFRIGRKADEKMTRGKHKDKPVKAYTIVHAAPKKA